MSAGIIPIFIQAGITPVFDSGKLVLRGSQAAITEPILGIAMAHKSALIIWCKSLDGFSAMAQSAQNLEQLQLTLSDFSRHRWSLIDRSRMASSFTPRALKLIEAAGVNKHRALEDFAALCWDSNSSQETQLSTFLEKGAQ